MVKNVVKTRGKSGNFNFKFLWQRCKIKTSSSFQQINKTDEASVIAE